MASPVENHIQSLKEQSKSIAAYSLPELPEPRAQEVYERISEGERNLASPSLTETGYQAGSARVDNELYEVRGTAKGLLTAEHATDHIRNGAKKEADWGVAGLGQVVREDTDTSFVAALGRQTGDANYDADHPLKSAIKTVMVEEKPLIVAGLHGMASGKFSDLTDTSAFDIFVGIGNNPSEKSQRQAETVREIASDLGLRAGVNQAFIKIAGGQPVYKEDGSLARNNFKAAGENTTRSFEQRVAEAHGLGSALMQVELTALLRRMPEGLELDPKSRVMGAYLGYVLVRTLVEKAVAPGSLVT